MGGFPSSGPFWGSFFYIRVPYYVGDLKGDAKLENYTHIPVRKSNWHGELGDSGLASEGFV